MRNLRVGKHHDIAVHVQFVALGLFDVLNPPIAVLVVELEESGLLPVPEPFRRRFVLQVCDSLQHIGPGKCGNRRSRCVQKSDKQQCPAGGASGIRYFRNRIEPDDHMRQSGCADHQRGCDEENVDHRLVAGRVGGEPERLVQAVEFVQQVHTRFMGEGAAETELRDRHSRDHDGNKNGRKEIREDQDPVLGDLGVRDSLHASQHSIKENDSHTDHDTGIDIHIEEAREDNPHAAHLSRHVGKGNKDRTDDRNNAGGLRVIPVADEGRDRILSELAKIGGQEQGQQHIATGPTHKIDRAIASHEGNGARHGNKRGGRHPIRRGRHAVHRGGDARACDVEFFCRRSPCPDSDHNIESEGCADDEKGPGLSIHENG